MDPTTARYVIDSQRRDRDAQVARDRLVARTDEAERQLATERRPSAARGLDSMVTGTRHLLSAILLRV